MTMKKEILMTAAVALMSLGAMSCKASDKDSDTGEDTASEMTSQAKGGDKMLAEEALEAMDAAAESESGVTMPEGEAPAELPSSMDPKDYKSTPSGLMYRELRPGTGKQPAGPAAVVKVDYAGKHLDGTVFDSSYDRGEPIEFPLNRVIPGWTEGVQLMKEGAKYEFLIPSRLAYGPKGTPGGPIRPNEDLYFVVELHEVK